MRRFAALGLVALVVLAGCVGPLGGGLGTGSPTSTAAGSATDPMPGNPWNQETLVVGINDSGDPDRDYAPQVQAALDYWATHEAAYSVGFHLDPDADNPDVVVRFVGNVVCGNESHNLGCSPLVSPDDSVTGPLTVRIQTGLTDGSTVRVLEHEFGHLLGLAHGEGPDDVMAPTYRPTYRSLPDATERDWPWRVYAITVHVDLSNVPEGDRETVRTQVRHALDYYEGGAGGFVPDNLTLRLVDDPREAMVNVSFPETPPCGHAPVSCAANGGYDMDTDPALEYYSAVRIAMTGIPPDAVGWHVAYWLGRSFGAERESELPPPLRDQSNADEAWWER